MSPYQATINDVKAPTVFDLKVIRVPMEVRTRVSVIIRMLQAQEISVLIWLNLAPVGFPAAFNLAACLPGEQSEAKLLNAAAKFNKIIPIIMFKLSDHESLSALKNQEANNQILSAFLKNNGGYLDDSDDEEEEEHDEDEPVNSLRSTVAFLKRIPYPFESRNPTPMPSAQFNDLSLLSISTSESSGKSSPNSSPRYYWNRAQPNVSASPSKNRSRFSIYKT
ncbi:uncharacterized protein PGTG_10076 [Puccinia graminis f. sp. tritici CRL 75-36-700-3]|uniref:Uncharacterized protein n=1 Tax=Puccinia graminis f. sp. tritici (strain CRL 75-36-700-3 / race SCCL) TaxID=418459 RepID=E3KJ81_PUCGT|nr:uncharacterized protein PGTG_10076 [Puccinia graminis f. sp. tritici CRL 75-36-700-3]EFP84356.2 hypothetical protein PGTG_10076 [Puccinia graminis f. sp. tritici CRL 75-36-700-3]